MSTTPPFRVVIPARYASTRLPGKPLADLAGRPMLAHVWERACASGAEAVTVATDDARIVEACRAFGADVELTDPRHASGTDRVAEVSRRRGWPEDTIVVNVQADEPLIPPANIAQVAQLFALGADVAVTTLYSWSEEPAERMSPHVVKVVCARDERALYFSRAPVPWQRDACPDGRAPAIRRHVGLYGYRLAALLQLAATPPCELEELEKLEQLRALWLGMRIQTAPAREAAPPGVDTPEDLERMRRLLG